MKRSNSWGTVTTVVLLVGFSNLFRMRGALGAALVKVGLPAWGAGLVLGAVVFALLSLALRWLLLKAVPEAWTHLPAHPQQFPQLDGAVLNGDTATLQALGFQWIADYTLVQPGGGTIGTGFARLFFHPTHHCYAELGQVFPPNQDPLPLCCTFMSTIGADWSLSTTNRTADRITYMIRRAKSLWTTHPKLDVPALLEAHLARRTEIAAGLALPVKSDLSWDAYWSAEQKSQSARRAVVKRRNLVLGLAEAQWFRLSPKTEWMGDFGKLRAKGS